MSRVYRHYENIVFIDEENMHWHITKGEAALRALLVRYSSGRKLCNCQHAYYDSEGRCAGGCSSNQFGVTQEIAIRAAEELKLPFWPIQEVREQQ